MTQYLKLYGETLVSLGYTVLPIAPGTKRPDLRDWPQHATTGDDVRRWYGNGRADHGAGINARDTPAIDVDVLDVEVSAAMATEIDKIFPNSALLTRTGQAPKFLIPFRSETPFRKMSSGVYTDGTHTHKVEILGDGQQWVAYHEHPFTRQPYTWFDGLSGGGVADVARVDLPLLDAVGAQRVIDAFEVLAAGMVASGRWSVKSTVPDRTSPVATDDPFAAHVPPVTDLSRPQIEALIAKLDPDEREDWVRAGRILHHQYAGEDAGLEIWHEWAVQSDKWKQETETTVWESFGNRHDAPETLRSLIKQFAEPKTLPPRNSEVEFVPAADFASAQRVEWHIKHVLPKRGLIVVYGEPGSSKSFFVLDMVAHVARGLPWRGHKVKQSSIAYIAAEGVAGFGNRLAAYAKHHETPLSNVSVFVRGGAFDLKTQFLAACDDINKLGNVGVIVIDTLSAVTPGANENTSEDMGTAIDAAQRIIEATGASVILIHHSNKQGDLRGWSGLRGAVDNQIRIERKEGLRTAHIEKQKEGEDGKAYGYRLKVIELYTDEDGDAVTSCVIEDAEETAPNTNSSKSTRKSRSGDFDTSDNYAKARRYLQIIEETAGLGGANIDESDVISAIQADFEVVNPLQEPDYPPARSIKRTLLTLAELGKIRKEGRWIRVG